MAGFYPRRNTSDAPAVWVAPPEAGRNVAVTVALPRSRGSLRRTVTRPEALTVARALASVRRLSFAVTLTRPAPPVASTTVPLRRTVMRSFGRAGVSVPGWGAPPGDGVNALGGGTSAGPQSGKRPPGISSVPRSPGAHPAGIEATEIPSAVP